TPLIAEEFVRFDREVSVIAVRSTLGKTAFYPLTENVHAGGILRSSRAPLRAAGAAALQRLAERHARRVMREVGYVGVLAIEFFQRGDELLANEMAPRVHNSGHWTIDGAACSQFENHLRAITGLPLGSTEPLGPVGMVNLIGDWPPLARLAAIENARVHLYDKQPRPGRKVGHVNVAAHSVAAREHVMRAVEREIRRLGSVS
ncbi:MAG: ATP-grasp domain-containing protein, partial [Phycisphaerae bacterium]|nr:ATP-grasp domain-containing protein [Phycisphaerae bacterium]